MTLLKNVMELIGEQLLWYQTEKFHLFLMDSEIDNCLFYLEITENYYGAE